LTRTIATVDDLREFEDRVRDLAVDGWDQDDAGRFDWDGFLARIERYLDVDLPTQMDDPVIRKVQRVARAAAREARV
jgi:uncharacterized protein (DUF2267 family)